jgi:hypothetical protein
LGVNLPFAPNDSNGGLIAAGVATFSNLITDMLPLISEVSWASHHQRKPFVYSRIS